MSRIPDDKNQDDFMNASAEEWSKPSTPARRSNEPREKTDRWGSPLPEKAAQNDPERWGSQPHRPASPSSEPPAKKGGTRWWLIVLILVILLCLCLCIILIGLPFLGYSVVPINFLPF